MVEFPSNIFDINALNDFATSQSFDYWIGLGINIIISTIIGGIVLLIILGIFSRKFGLSIQIGNAFLLVLIANIINFFGVMGLILPFVLSVPFVALILPVLIWIILLKLFFRDMKLIYAVIIGIVFYFLTIALIPLFVAMVMGYIPSF